MLNITDVKIFKKKEEGSYVGVATVIFENDFVVYGIRIYNNEGVKSISMPSKKIKDKWVNICHPINKDSRAALEKAIFEAYDAAE